MVIDHAGGLHERIADRRSNEREAAPFEVRAQHVRLPRPGGNLSHARPSVPPRRPSHEFPHERVERPELLPHLKERLCISDGPLDLEPVSDDAFVGEEPPDILRLKLGYPLRVESMERPLEV